MSEKKRGRKPLTNDQRVARGEIVPGVNTPKPIEGHPECPDYLDDVARDCWHRLVTILDDLGVLSKSDVIEVAMICTLFSRWRQAEAAIARDGLFSTTQSGYTQQSAAVTLATNSMKLLSKMLGNFGLSPVARSRVAVQLQEDTDVLAEFLARRKTGTS